MNRPGERAKAIGFMLGGLLLGVLLGILIVAGGPGLAAGFQPRQPPTVGSPVLDFTLPAPDNLDGSPGKKVRLNDFKGRAVVINFWATWCVPCKEEMPLFERYARRAGNQVVWLGVNELESAQAVNVFIQEFKISFPIVLDSDGQVAQDYYVRGYPTTFFVDANGVLRAQHLGQVNEELLKGYLETVGFKP